jgi:hypothetical protein
MKNTSRAIAIMSFGAALSLGIAAVSFAADNYNYHEREEHEREEWQVKRSEKQKDFALGLCAGQALAQQGITVPPPKHGERPQPMDPNTQAALKSAVETCRAEMRGASPTPAPSPSAIPSTAPSVAPSP